MNENDPVNILLQHLQEKGYLDGIFTQSGYQPIRLPSGVSNQDVQQARKNNLVYWKAGQLFPKQ